MVALGLIASSTERISLGTGSLIPQRHPIHTARLLSSLEFVAGPGRVIAGFGIGTYHLEFGAAGQRAGDRREVLPAQIDIIRRPWTRPAAGYRGKFYAFDRVRITPRPPPEA